MTESQRIFSIGLDKITVQIVVFGVAPKTIRHWAILIGARGRIAIQGAPDIVNRNHSHREIFWTVFWV